VGFADEEGGCDFVYLILFYFIYATSPSLSTYLYIPSAYAHGKSLQESARVCLDVITTLH